MKTYALRSGAILLIAFCLSSCGRSHQGQSYSLAEQHDISDVRVLEWEDLLPEGELEYLENLYSEFYEGLETRMSSLAVPLSQASKQLEDIEEGSDLDFMPQLGTFSTVAGLDGQRVRLPGFIVPLDFESGNRLTNFLLVPYYGACIHTPPPPPNQIVYVEGTINFKEDDMWLPFWIEGVMRTSAFENDLGDAAYTLELSQIKPYGE